MKNSFPPFLVFAFLMLATYAHAQHTFSIVAVDAITGEVGSAGATCLTSADCGGCGGAIIISELVPGKGAINAQATVCIPNINLINGADQIRNDKDADQTLAFLLEGDACVFGDKLSRQYGIVTLDNMNQVKAIGYTGVNTLDYKNHKTGTNYSIQGNILIGPQVLDSMEQRFLRATGSLAEKLMFALQGANIPGADSRCLVDGISSRSAFLRVARPGDSANDFYLDLNVPSTFSNAEPIDSLQSLFNAWSMSTSTEELQIESGIRLYPNPAKGEIQIELKENVSLNELHLQLFDLQGKLLENYMLTGNQNISITPGLDTGLYIYRILDADHRLLKSGRITYLKN